MLALDLSKKDEKKEKILKEKIINCLKNKKMDWEDFLFLTGNCGAKDCVFAPRRENIYNEPSISFYKDGTIWVSGARGSVQMFRKCPYKLMFEMYMQKFYEITDNEREAL